MHSERTVMQGNTQERMGVHMSAQERQIMSNKGYRKRPINEK